MGDKQVTVMVMHIVDLQCYCCYKKVKKLLCRFSEVRNQVYDEKQNTVTITVVSCCPERIRDKLSRNGGKTIKSIEIKLPSKPKEAEKPKTPEKPKAAEKPKEAEKPKVSEKPKEPEKPKASEKPKEAEKPKASEKPKEAEKPKSDGKPAAAAAVPVPAPKTSEPTPPPPQAQAAPMMQMIPAQGYPSVFPYEACYEPCYEGRAVGPYYYGYGRPEPNYGNYGYNNYGYGPYVNKCDYYPIEENNPACTIM